MTDGLIVTEAGAPRMARASAAADADDERTLKALFHIHTDTCNTAFYCCIPAHIAAVVDG